MFKRPESSAIGKMVAVLSMVAVFVAGVLVGYHNRPEIAKVRGLFDLTLGMPGTATGTESGIELSTCVDAKGTEVPCILDRTDVLAKDNAPADFAQFWKAWNIINERFVPAKEAVSNQEKVWGAIAGLAESLGDPYTYFLPPQEKSLFEEDVSGSFGGVGMQIGMRNGILTAVAPLRDSPAERAGVQKGDYIIAVDGATTSDMTIDKALYLIRGPIGTKVTLTLLRESSGTPESPARPFDVNIVREPIQVPTIDTEKKDDVFIIRLYGFPATGADLFRNALREFVQSGTNKLVLDMRGNPGGYLEIAVDMASWFLPQGKIVVSEEEKGGKGKEYRSRGYNVFGDNFHFVILVDGGSASAAEILAGALSQHGVAKLVGTKTFGKGSVQELVSITDTTSLKVTIARWVTPNGTDLSNGGLEPDFKVEITKEDVDNGRDPQLDKAIEVVRTLMP